MLAGALLVMGGTNHSHHNTQENTDGQGHGGDNQSGAHTVQILLPATAVDESLIEFDVEFLPSGGLTGAKQGLPGFVLFHKLTSVSYYSNIVYCFREKAFGRLLHADN